MDKRGGFGPWSLAFQPQKSPLSSSSSSSPRPLTLFRFRFKPTFVAEDRKWASCADGETTQLLKRSTTGSGSEAPSPSMTVDRAPTKERPFANMVNPYDNACSVLCNHPYGNRLTWFARKFIVASKLAGKPDEGPDDDEDGPKEGELRSSAALPLLAQTPGGSKAAADGRRKKKESLERAAAKKLHDHLQKTGSLKDQRRPSVKKTGRIERKKSSKSKEKRAKREKRKNKKGKKGKKQAARAEEAPAKKRVKHPHRRREIPASREEVENPLTLVENGGGVQRTTKKGHGTNFVDLRSLAIDYKSIAPAREGQLAWNDEIRDTVQKELDSELEGSEFDPKRLQELQDLLRTNAESEKSKASNEMQNISEEIGKKTLRSESWMHYPRIPSIRCCRFELPMDVQELTTLTPIKYLSSFCVVPRKRRQLFFKVFTKNRGLENAMPLENVPKAFQDIFGGPLEESMLRTIYEFAQLDGDAKLELTAFVGLASLAERILCSERKARRASEVLERVSEDVSEGVSEKGPKKVAEDEEPEQVKDTVEEMDFSNLAAYLERTSISKPIKDLLDWIQRS